MALSDLIRINRVAASEIFIKAPIKREELLKCLIEMDRELNELKKRVLELESKPIEEGLFTKLNNFIKK